MYWNSLQDVQKMRDILSQDKIILGSSDTVLGLFGQLTQQSYDALDRLKHRNEKPYLVMIGSVDKLPMFIDQSLNEKLTQIISLCWPGPVTLIFKARKDLPKFLQSPAGTIALRVPNHSGLLTLLQSFDGLFSTSANVHGQPIPETIAGVNQSIKDGVAGICVDTVDQICSLSPSTILDCSSEQIKIVRQGCDLDDRVKELLR